MIFLHRILSNQLPDSVYTCWNREKASEFIRRSATAPKNQHTASCLTPRRLFLIVPSNTNYGRAHMTFKPNVHTSKAIPDNEFLLFKAFLDDAAPERKTRFHCEFAGGRKLYSLQDARNDNLDLQFGFSAGYAARSRPIIGPQPRPCFRRKSHNLAARLGAAVF
jgi:hypothetical protein